MKQLLIFSQRPELVNYLSHFWEDCSGCVPVFCDDVEELKSYLGLFRRIDILVIDRETKADLSGVDAHLRSSVSVIRALSLSDDEDPCATETFHPMHWLAVAEKVKEICGEKGTESFIGMPINTLVHFQDLPFSLFLRLDSGRLLKRFHACEEIDQETIREYRSRGMKELFLERRFGRDFINLLLNNMVNRLDRHYEEKDQRDSARAEVFRTVQEIVSTIGMKPRIIGLCETLMKNLIDEVLENQSGEVLTHIHNLRFNRKMDFQYRLIQLTSFIVAHVHGGRQRPDAPRSLGVLVSAIFFADISLKDPELVRYRGEELVSLLPEKEALLVTNHAAASAAVMEESELVSTEVVKIIREHHGSLTGEGMPYLPDERIGESARRLFVAQQIAYALLTRADENHWLVFREVAGKFERTFLAEYFLSFERSFLNYEDISV